ncbi:hypothetical protein HAT2_00721 [Candidatus Similichlamydia laticola]|uniref:Tail specific protease domain-containing protein n=1 Tax=Candidatus Similichlamydia laticola TaxID=2170265 RepID=A0A369KE51_9BACT|nr:hypothetical protein HAT2_00721 [Candidatus Similichlamydia laticola]
MIADLYAPLLWKEKRYGFSWRDEVACSFDRVVAGQCDASFFYCEVGRLMSLLRDPHCLVTSVYPHSRQVLPFYLCCADDAVFIQDVQPGFVEGMSPGQRVASIDGEPIEQLFNRKLLAVFGEGPYPNWAYHHICELLVRQGPPFGVGLSSGPVHVGILEEDGRERKFLVDWMNVHEDHVFYPSPSQEALLRAQRNVINFQATCCGKELRDVPPIGSLENFFVGSKGSFLAPLGEILWSSRTEPGASLEAYLAESNGRRVGYLRLPDFSSWDMEECNGYLGYFQRESDCLVLDLMHNPGGSGINALHLCSAFSSEPVKNHPEMMRLSPALFDWAKELSYVVKFPDSQKAKEALHSAGVFFEMDTRKLAGLQRFCDQIVSALYKERGDAWPVYWLGLEQFDAGGVFKKPLFVLCDSLSMSAAESFLLLMQINRLQRPVWIIGSPTAGVGGAYESIPFPNVEGIKEVSYSWSLLIDPRTNKPIEDVGICPDVCFPFTAQDIKGSFCPFRDKVLKMVHDNLDVGRVGLYSY